MRKVGIKQLKNRLSEYVRAAAAGETVLVTDRDRVVAKLAPVEPGRPSGAPEAEVLAQLVAEGLVTPASAPRGAAPPALAGVPFDELMRELERDRADRW
jgi:prevent-host-death family protein